MRVNPLRRLHLGTDSIKHAVDKDSTIILDELCHDGLGNRVNSYWYCQGLQRTFVDKILPGNYRSPILSWSFVHAQLFLHEEGVGHKNFNPLHWSEY